MKAISSEALSYKSTRVLSVDIDHPIRDLVRRSNPDSQEYMRAMILVRLHNQPMGIVEVDIPENGLTADRLASQIWGELKNPIHDHLLADNFPMPDRLSKVGFETNPMPLCLKRQNDLLDAAPFVSVVVSTRDRVASLQECLRSILASDYPCFEVIVVDNAPESDQTAHFVRSAFGNSEKVRYLREDVPGLAVAHNHALAELEAPIVAITDDDVLVDQNWLKSLALNFQRDPMTGCVTGMILPYELETPAQVWIEQFGGFGKGFKRITYDLTENRPRDILFPYAAGRFGSGANMAFRTSVLRAIGGFDPALGAGTLAKGADDLAVFFDMITHGYRLVYEPAAVLYHKHHRDYAGLANQMYGYGVGLSAFLMGTIMKDPRRLMEISLKVPSGLKYILDPRSPKNRKKKNDYPRELTLLELKGFLVGPMAYLLSRRRVRKLIGKGYVAPRSEENRF